MLVPRGRGFVYLACVIREPLGVKFMSCPRISFCLIVTHHEIYLVSRFILWPVSPMLDANALS